MNKQDLINRSLEYFKLSPMNYVTVDGDVSKELVGMKIYDEPIFGFAEAGDEYFRGLKEKKAIGSFHKTPTEWLTSAKTVISIFMPFTEAVVESNGMDMRLPSKEWLHARIEGHAFLADMVKHVNWILEEEGFQALVPASDAAFTMIEAPGTNPKLEGAQYTSNWSERHVAFGCGLGTFGLSKGIITEKGISGRLGSLVTSASFEATTRDYTELYEYCTNCGACAGNCPVKCISQEHGKQHQPCAEFLDMTKVRYAPRYGCGKCQTKVPCARRRP